MFHIKRLMLFILYVEWKSIQLEIIFIFVKVLTMSLSITYLQYITATVIKFTNSIS